MNKPIRASTTHGEQLNVPTPSQNELKRWQPLVDACTRAVMTNEREDNVAKKAMIRMWLPKGWKSSGDVPPEVVENEPKKLAVINAEIILLWLWKRKLAEKSPGQIYSERQTAKLKFTNLLKSIDIDLDDRYNV